jgi:Fic-DOC domain mobile mystery protein B
MKIIQTPGATPLEHEELEGLLPRTITTHEELNAAEAANILEADTWLNRRKRKLSNVLQIDFLIQLHKKMFSKTWKWAGQFRKTNKNIGCDKAYIVEELKKLLDDTEYQCNAKFYVPQEIAARFHHRLVKIHPFPNGNGRHARMATNALLACMGEESFSWGSEWRKKNETRDRYISALQAADRNNYEPLFHFLQINTTKKIQT